MKKGGNHVAMPRPHRYTQGATATGVTGITLGERITVRKGRDAEVLKTGRASEMQSLTPPIL